MATQPIAGSTSSAATTSSSSGLNSLDGNDFLELLTAQLKNQSPESAQDPSTFVNQLAMFSQLEQLIDIHSILQPDASTTSATTGNTPTTQSQDATSGVSGS
jgi:flagellar basal-body rod modification protein FlgD